MNLINIGHIAYFWLLQYLCIIEGTEAIKNGSYILPHYEVYRNPFYPHQTQAIHI